MPIAEPRPLMHLYPRAGVFAAEVTSAVHGLDALGGVAREIVRPVFVDHTNERARTRVGPRARSTPERQRAGRIPRNATVFRFEHLGVQTAVDFPGGASGAKEGTRAPAVASHSGAALEHVAEVRAAERLAKMAGPLECRR